MTDTSFLSTKDAAALISSIRIILDYPKPNIVFHDILPCLANPESFHLLIEVFAQQYQHQNIDVIAGIEARGFIIASALAYRLGVGFIPIRKKGKLPFNTISKKYQLEYGTSEVEIQTDALKKGQRIVLIDDLIATGQTILACIDLINELGGDLISVGAFIEFLNLPGGEAIRKKGTSLYSIYQSSGDINHYRNNSTRA